MPLKPVDGDLAKTRTHESDESWPTMIEIVAYFGKDGRKGKRRSKEISADQFFGRKGFGAPMSGDQMIAIVEQLRREK